MNLTKISRFLSLILRHKPEAINIQLDEHGWANVKDLIEGVSESYDFNMSMLEEIVRTDEKQRYSFNEDKTLIRANRCFHLLSLFLQAQSTAQASFRLVPACQFQHLFDELIQSHYSVHFHPQ